MRKHKTLGTTPAVAAGVELERWSLERVVDMTADYMRRKEDAEFEHVRGCGTMIFRTPGSLKDFAIWTVISLLLVLLGARGCTY